MLNENNNEQEISSETINKYVNSLHRLSLATGKLDNILLYLEQTYPNDKFLIHSLSSILKDVTIVNQDNKYERTVYKNDSLPPLADINDINPPKDTFRYETTSPILNVSPTCAESSTVEISNEEFHYKFKNSTNLDEIWYEPKAKLLKVKFKNNQRLYHYISVPDYHIKTMVILDKEGGSAGKYFNSEIVKVYEYRETTSDEEIIG